MQAADIPNFVRKTVGREWLDVYFIVSIGATGAPTISATEHPDLTIARASAGLYNVTAPAALNYFVDFMLVAADVTPTSNNFQLTALAPTSGTFSFLVTNGLTATDIESGSTLVIRVAMRHQVPVGS